jgi:hypothetical protein
VSRSEIEAELAEEFDHEQLAVYADVLQTEGDPRGELIALDLANSDAEREALLVRWLGPELAATVDSELGFITGICLDNEEQLAAWLAHPAAHYVRGASITGPQHWVGHAARQLAERSGRWLAQLSLRVIGWGPMANDIVENFFAAAPRLERLEVWGQGVLGEVGHPHVKSLRVTGGDAIRSLLFSGPARFPSVIALDFAFDDTGFDPNRTFLERLPALRRLDLSSNEPGDTAPSNLGGHADAAYTLGLQPARVQLTHLRLPSVRSRAAADRLTSLIATLPNLREVKIARAYRQFMAVFLPPVVTVPEERWPWPPPDLATMQIDISVGHHNIPIVPLIVWIETVFDDLPKEAQTLWRRVFGILDSDDEGDVEVPLTLWRAALATLDETDELAPWRALLDQLERGFVDVRVQLTRGVRD